VAALTGSGIVQAGQRSWLTPVVRGLLRLAFAGRTRAIFQNQADLAAFAGRRLVSVDRAYLIAGSGIDTVRLAPEADDSRGARDTFLMASRMLWSKGVGDFVAAARLVRRTNPNAKFVLFGGAQDDYGSKNPDFIDRAWLDALNAEGVVAWRGWTPPEIVEAAMRRAAAVVLPSSYGEGVPRSLTEAAAAGVPIITTGTPGCRDTVLPGESGFVCRANAPEELASAMVELLRRPELVQAMGAAGRRLALERFDQAHVVKRTLEVYAAALAAP
jgi:glycosyltransferase involved in cell wall biosynthesis